MKRYLVRRGLVADSERASVRPWPLCARAARPVPLTDRHGRRGHALA